MSDTGLRPYRLDMALAADRHTDCIVIDVGCDKSEYSVASLSRINDSIVQYEMHGNATAFSATKLYVIGDWTVDKPHQEAKNGAVTEWQLAAKKISVLLQKMGNLRELTWVSGLPFLPSIMDQLPASLTKLVVDLGQPIRLDYDGKVVHKSYMTSIEMKPLQDLTNLKELRLFRMYSSLQSIVWETVFRNTSDGGMHVLDIQMASAPIVRLETWRKAKDVSGLTVPLEDSEEKEYKGLDGKGVLHYSIGTGEYLDDLCIRKARISSGLEETTPIPLWSLQLDGFVVDRLPFEHDLSRIVLLACGENCIDGGLRAPKTLNAPHNKWSRAVNNATSHCLIQFPDWTGIFDDRGLQRNKCGAVVPQGLGVSTPVAELTPSPIFPLTKESLNMKGLDEALDSDHFTGLASPSRSSVDHFPLGAISNVSTRGSEVPTSTVASSTATHSPPLHEFVDLALPTIGNFVDVGLPGPDDDNNADCTPTTSMSSSLKQIESPEGDGASNAANVGSGKPASTAEAP